MKTTVVCSEVRPATEKNGCVVVAYRDDRHEARESDLTDPANWTAVRDRLRAQGILLGGPLQPARLAGVQSSLAPPVQIIAHDEGGSEHRLVADQWEEYSLSSGSTLYFLSLSESPGDCGWLVGRTLEVAEFGDRRQDTAAPSTPAEGGRDPGFSEVTGSPR
jgi:hypothetical protein